MVISGKTSLNLKDRAYLYAVSHLQPIYFRGYLDLVDSKYHINHKRMVSDTDDADEHQRKLEIFFRGGESKERSSKKLSRLLKDWSECDLTDEIKKQELDHLIDEEEERLSKRLTRSTARSLPEEEKIIESYRFDGIKYQKFEELMLKFPEVGDLISEELERPSKRVTTRSLTKEEKVLETSASASSNGKKKKKKK